MASCGQPYPRKLEQHQVVAGEQKNQHHEVDQIVREVMRLIPAVQLSAPLHDGVDLILRERFKPEMSFVELRPAEFFRMNVHPRLSPHALPASLANHQLRPTNRKRQSLKNSGG